MASGRDRKDHFGYVGRAPTVDKDGRVSKTVWNLMAGSATSRCCCLNLPAVPRSPMWSQICRAGLDAAARLPPAGWPRYHYFGDVHRLQATTWRVGASMMCQRRLLSRPGRPVRHTTSRGAPEWCGNLRPITRSVCRLAENAIRPSKISAPARLCSRWRRWPTLPRMGLRCGRSRCWSAP